MQRRNEVALYGAAETSITEFDHIIVRADNQTAVDIYIAEFIHNDRKALLVIFRQDAVGQSGFTAA